MNTTYLTAQLRESAPYVQDAGWHQTAALMIAAADEIEQLRTERSVLTQSTVHHEVAPNTQPGGVIVPAL